jgi:hypothetical protein
MRDVRRLAWLLFFIVLLPAAASADEGSYFSFAFGGGALLPTGQMKKVVVGGLDVFGRLGWTSSIGLGLVLGFDWAPLRNADTSGQTSLFQATAAPRFTLGTDVLRVWISAGGGVLVRTGETAFTLNGAGGLDLHVFGSGGFSLLGGYARGVSQTDVEYFSLSAGLVFTL